MGKKKKNGNFLFNAIAPVYGLFYAKQKKRFFEIIDIAGRKLDLHSFKTIIDVGCGTGALCSALSELGLSVTGIDPAERMLRIAERKSGDRPIRFIRADALKRLPFADREFDISIASYVAHGLQPEDRKRMYTEMSRITKRKVIIYDYNENRSFLTTVIEWLEHGDYFHFIRYAEKEMNECVSEMKMCFSAVEAVSVSERAAWYICTPAHNG